MLHRLGLLSHKDNRDALLMGCPGCALTTFGLLASAVCALGWWNTGVGLERAAWTVGSLGLALFVIAIVRIRLSRARIARYQRERNEVAARIHAALVKGERPECPYFVYLRPFSIDEMFVEADFRSGAGDDYVEKYGVATASHDIESALALLVEPVGALVCLSDKPGEVSAGHFKSSDDRWQSDVTMLCESAAGIFIVPFDTKGTRWEVGTIVKRSWLDRTVFVMPAQSVLRRWMRIRWLSADYRSLWEQARAAYLESGLMLPPYDERGAMLRVRDGEPEVLGLFADQENRRLVDRLREVLRDLASAQR